MGVEYEHITGAQTIQPRRRTPSRSFVATGMVYIVPLNAFLCMASDPMSIWAIPTSERQIDIAESICTRENILRRAAMSGQRSL